MAGAGAERGGILRGLWRPLKLRMEYYSLAAFHASWCCNHVHHSRISVRGFGMGVFRWNGPLGDTSSHVNAASRSRPAELSLPCSWMASASCPGQLLPCWEGAHVLCRGGEQDVAQSPSMPTRAGAPVRPVAMRAGAWQVPR